MVWDSRGVLVHYEAARLLVKQQHAHVYLSHLKLMATSGEDDQPEVACATDNTLPARHVQLQ